MMRQCLDYAAQRNDGGEGLLSSLKMLPSRRSMREAPNWRYHEKVFALLDARGTRNADDAHPGEA